MLIQDAMAITLRALHNETGTLGSEDDPTFVKGFLFDPRGASVSLTFRVGGIPLQRFYGGATINKASLDQELAIQTADAGFPGLPALPNVSGTDTVLEIANFVDAFADKQLAGMRPRSVPEPVLVSLDAVITTGTTASSSDTGRRLRGDASTGRSVPADTANRRQLRTAGTDAAEGVPN